MLQLQLPSEERHSQMKILQMLFFASEIDDSSYLMHHPYMRIWHYDRDVHFPDPALYIRVGLDTYDKWNSRQRGPFFWNLHAAILFTFVQQQMWLRIFAL